MLKNKIYFGSIFKKINIFNLFYNSLIELIKFVSDNLNNRMYVQARFETSMNYNSYVKMSKKKIVCNWEISDEDIDKIINTSKLIVNDLIKNGYQNVKLNPILKNKYVLKKNKNKILGIGHNQCITTMSDNLSSGVVDKNLKSHQIENLYICSNSVFASCGKANPTFTLLALCFRLADYLKKNN